MVTDSLCSDILTSAEENFYCRQGLEKIIRKNLMNTANFRKTVTEITVTEPNEKKQKKTDSNTGHTKSHTTRIVWLVEKRSNSFKNGTKDLSCKTKQWRCKGRRGETKGQTVNRRHLWIQRTSNCYCALWEQFNKQFITVYQAQLSL